MEASENDFSVTGTELSQAQKRKKNRKSESIAFRITYFVLCAFSLGGSVAAAAYFEIQCYEQMYLPLGPGLIVMPLKIIEACAWIFVVTCVVCMAMVMLKCHNCAATTAGQLFFVTAIIATAASTFYTNVNDRYHEKLKKVHFTKLDDELMQKGALAISKNYKHLLGRKIDVQFYYFIDKFQKDNKCCGLGRFDEWLDNETQYFLHADYRASCRPHTDRGIPEKGPYPMPFQCNPIFSQQTQKFPKSCCKPNSKEKECIQSDDANSNDLVFDRGCRPTLYKILHDTCYPAVIIPAAISPILTIYLTCVLWAFSRYAVNASFFSGCCFCDPTPKTKESSISIITKITSTMPSRRFRIRSEMVKKTSHPKTPPSSPYNERASVPERPKASIPPIMDTKQQNVAKINENQVSPQVSNKPPEPPKQQRPSGGAPGLSSMSSEGTNPRPNAKLR